MKLFVLCCCVLCSFSLHSCFHYNEVKREQSTQIITGIFWMCGLLCGLSSFISRLTLLRWKWMKKGHNKKNQSIRLKISLLCSFHSSSLLIRHACFVPFHYTSLPCEWNEKGRKRNGMNKGPWWVLVYTVNLFCSFCSFSMQWREERKEWSEKWAKEQRQSRVKRERTEQKS